MKGCLTVEMEGAAFFVVAQFRGIKFGQLLYGGDDVSDEMWNHRNWDLQMTMREKLFRLVVESVLKDVNGTVYVQLSARYRCFIYSGN